MVERLPLLAVLGASFPGNGVQWEGSGIMSFCYLAATVPPSMQRPELDVDYGTPLGLAERAGPYS
jgi:hypothetical protein